MGTSREEEGNPPHFGTVNKLNKVGIPVIPHRAKQITIADYDRFDFIIAMDGGNIRDLNRIMGGDPKHKIFKFLSFAGSDGDIADPWYTGDFDDTYRDIDKSCDGLLSCFSQNGVIG